MNVPLGLSTEYDELPIVEPLRAVHCQLCWLSYQDAPRALPDGMRVMACMCNACRTKAREQWIAAHRVELPRAVARYVKAT